MTLGDWLLALKPAQILAILAALAALVIGAFSLGAWLGAKGLAGGQPLPPRASTAAAIIEIASSNISGGSA
jgi:uncharacterized membrane protein YbhN (UPF0104 family)